MCVPIYNQNRPRENCKMATERKKKPQSRQKCTRGDTVCKLKKVHLVFIISLDEQQTVVMGTDSTSQIMHYLFIPVFILKSAWGLSGLESVVFSSCPFHHFFRDYFAQLCGLCSPGLLSCLQLPWLWKGFGMQDLGWRFWDAGLGLQVWDAQFGAAGFLIKVLDAGLRCRSGMQVWGCRVWDAGFGKQVWGSRFFN